MKYFALIDELFDFNYLMTEDVLRELPTDMLNNMQQTLVYSNINSELDPDTEGNVRVDRNIKLYFDIIKRLEKNNPLILEDAGDIFNLIDKTNKEKPEIDTLITNT